MTQLEKDITLIDLRIKLNRIKILELEAEIVNLSQLCLNFNQNILHGKCFKAFANSTHWYQIIEAVSIHGTDVYCRVRSVSNSTTLEKHTYHHPEDAVEITVKEFNTRLEQFEANLIQKCKQLEPKSVTNETNFVTNLLTIWYKKLIN